MSEGKAIVMANPRISVVDDDASMRVAIKCLLKAAGYDAEVFASAEEVLNSGRLGGTACLVVDVCMPGMSGIELQDRLIALGHAVPIIFITAHVDAHERARALERGAVGCLQKPFRHDALLDAVSRAIGARSTP